MVKTLTRGRSIINQRYPILKNFPFNEDFTIDIFEPTPVQQSEESVNISEIPVVNFRYNKESVELSVSIEGPEIIWLDEISDSIKNLDKISKQLNKGIKTKSLLVKRDMAINADLWMTQISAKRKALSHQVFNDMLMSLTGNRSIDQIVLLTNNLNKLYSKHGLVKLSSSDCNLIFTYLHFRLIYTKLILGIIISSKISI